MKKGFLVLFVFTGFYIQAQLNFEGQLGGSGFLGYTVKTEVLADLSETAPSSLGLSLGLGTSFHQEGALIYQFALNYYFGNWGLGSEISGFSKNPFFPNSNEPDLAFIVYPNLNHAFKLKNGDYIKVSAGILLAYEEATKTDFSNAIQYAGDPIPGVGISYGIHYEKK